MDWRYLIYSIILLASSVGIFMQNKKWVQAKKELDGLSSIDKGFIFTKAWMLIVLLSLGAIICLFKFLNI